MTVNIQVGKTQLFTIDNGGDCHLVGYHGSARAAGQRWALYGVEGNLLRYTRNEQVAIDHCMGY